MSDDLQKLTPTQKAVWRKKILALWKRSPNTQHSLAAAVHEAITPKVSVSTIKPQVSRLKNGDLATLRSWRKNGRLETFASVLGTTSTELLDIWCSIAAGGGGREVWHPAFPALPRRELYPSLCKVTRRGRRRTRSSPRIAEDGEQPGPVVDPNAVLTPTQRERLRQAGYRLIGPDDSEPEVVFEVCPTGVEQGQQMLRWLQEFALLDKEGEERLNGFLQTWRAKPGLVPQGLRTPTELLWLLRVILDGELGLEPVDLRRYACERFLDRLESEVDGQALRASAGALTVGFLRCWVRRAGSLEVVLPPDAVADVRKQATAALKNKAVKLKPDEAVELLRCITRGTQHAPVLSKLHQALDRARAEEQIIEPLLRSRPGGFGIASLPFARLLLAADIAKKGPKDSLVDELIYSESATAVLTDAILFSDDPGSWSKRAHKSKGPVQVALRVALLDALAATPNEDAWRSRYTHDWVDAVFLHICGFDDPWELGAWLEPSIRARHLRWSRALRTHLPELTGESPYKALLHRASPEAIRMARQRRSLPGEDRAGLVLGPTVAEADLSVVLSCPWQVHLTTQVSVLDENGAIAPLHLEQLRERIERAADEADPIARRVRVGVPQGPLESRLYEILLGDFGRPRYTWNPDDLEGLSMPWASRKKLLEAHLQHAREDKVDELWEERMALLLEPAGDEGVSFLREMLRIEEHEPEQPESFGRALVGVAHRLGQREVLDELVEAPDRVLQRDPADWTRHDCRYSRQHPLADVPELRWRLALRDEVLKRCVADYPQAGSAWSKNHPPLQTTRQRHQALRDLGSTNLTDDDWKTLRDALHSGRSSSDEQTAFIEAGCHLPQYRPVFLRSLTGLLTAKLHEAKVAHWLDQHLSLKARTLTGHVEEPARWVEQRSRLLQESAPPVAESPRPPAPPSIDDPIGDLPEHALRRRLFTEGCPFAYEQLKQHLGWEQLVREATDPNSPEPHTLCWHLIFADAAHHTQIARRLLYEVDDRLDPARATLFARRLSASLPSQHPLSIEAARRANR